MVHIRFGPKSPYTKRVVVKGHARRGKRVHHYYRKHSKKVVALKGYVYHPTSGRGLRRRHM